MEASTIEWTPGVSDLDSYSESEDAQLSLQENPEEVTPSLIMSVQNLLSVKSWYNLILQKEKSGIAYWERVNSLLANSFNQQQQL
jgi:hypothetical protein